MGPGDEREEEGESRIDALGGLFRRAEGGGEGGSEEGEGSHSQSCIASPSGYAASPPSFPDVLPNPPLLQVGHVGALYGAFLAMMLAAGEGVCVCVCGVQQGREGEGRVQYMRGDAPCIIRPGRRGKSCGT